MKRIMNLADRHARALGLLLAAALAALTAALNVSRGPLSNLNDIGGWTNRMAFIALAAAAHAAVLAMQALLNRKGFGRLALRQVLTTLGFLLLTLPINQKTLLFTEQVLPLVRKMDAMGLAAANESALNLSAPALTLLYAVTRGPIYDMYSIKRCAWSQSGAGDFGGARGGQAKLGRSRRSAADAVPDSASGVSGGWLRGANGYRFGVSAVRRADAAGWRRPSACRLCWFTARQPR